MVGASVYFSVHSRNILLAINAKSSDIYECGPIIANRSAFAVF